MTEVDDGRKDAVTADREGLIRAEGRYGGGMGI